jgi:cytochrome b
MDATVKVWDPIVRVFHWSLVASFAVVWLSAEELDTLHEWVGYAMLALVGLRLLWGLTGPRYARFTQFVRHPATVVAYLKNIVAGKEKRYIGHNPAGGMMIIALLVSVVAVGVTGWLCTTDAFWGVKWMEEVHGVIANAMLAMVALHVTGVIVASRRHGENLVRSMITGRKRVADAQDVA